MKVALCSDLHLEFGDLDIKNTENADVLVLAGDIMVAADMHDFPEDVIKSEWAKHLPGRYQQAQKFRDFLKRCSTEFSHVLYVAGNHEFYNGKWEQTLSTLRDECKKFHNVHFMENDTFKLDGVTFIGGTLWTDCNKSDPLTLHCIESSMNDFRIIRVESDEFRRLRPVDTIVRHYKTLDYVRHVTAEKPNEKFFVIGHHAPSKLSTHPRYANDQLMNGGYSTDLSEFILDRPQIKVWVHGHTHDDFSYVIGQTRVACHPRGYMGHERGSQEDDPYYPMIIEV